MITASELTEIGRYNKTHGINGEISASFDVDADVVGELTTLVSEMDGIFVPFFVNALRPKNRETVLLTIDGISTEQQAKQMVNKAIYALTKELPEQDDVYCDYFIGFTIVDEDGREIGKIEDVDDSTENALFIVSAQGGTVYIPISEDFISDIDEDSKTIEMALPEGLLDL